MALNFPNNPTISQTFTYGNKTWVWDGISWATQVVPIAGQSGYSGYSGAQGTPGTGLTLKGSVAVLSSLSSISATVGDAYIINDTKELYVYNGEGTFPDNWTNAGQIQGPSGYSGYSGSGISGYSGFSGISGYSGSGISGYSGFSGINGYSGFSGYSMPTGGASGQVLTKQSSTDYDTIWKTATVSNVADSIVERGVSGDVHVGSLFFTPLSNGFSTTAGETWYSVEEDCLNVACSDGSVLQVGQEFYMPPCKNNSGVIIPNGSFVMATGAQGDRITIAKAVTDGTYDPLYMIGVATSEISIGSEFARITTNGIVRDIDTSAWGIGTLSDQPGGILYPDPLVPGGLTLTKPNAPAIRTPIAIVLRVHENTGRIYVRMTNGSVLGGTDSNVKFTDLQNNDVVAYDSTFSGWVNKNISGFSGYSGNSGFSGISGYSGISGFSGYSSYSGYSGISGYSGFSGISGYSGSGISGYSGFSGRSGWSGYAGIGGSTGSVDRAILIASGTVGTTIQSSSIIVTSSNNVYGDGTEIVTKTDNYTLVLTDAGKTIEMNKATAVTLTVPANSSVQFPIGTVINILQYGAGQVTVAITTDTLRSSGSKTKLTGQYSMATLVKRASTEWYLAGDIA